MILTPLPFGSGRGTRSQSQNLGVAEELAREAIAALPDDPKTLSDMARIIEVSSLDGIEFALKAHEKALALNPYSREFRDRQERCEDAATLAKYVKSSGISIDLLRRLGAPWYVWKVLQDEGSNDYRKSIQGSLGKNLGQHSIDESAVEELANEVAHEQFDDPLTQALLKGNLARAAYQRWYKDRVEVDLDEVEMLFREALGERPKEVFIRTWYGTFLKEARQDYRAAEVEYARSLKDAVGTSRENHPMLLNNLALLFLDDKEKWNTQSLEKARDQITTAIEVVESTGSDFLVGV